MREYRRLDPVLQYVFWLITGNRSLEVQKITRPCLVRILDRTHDTVATTQMRDRIGLDKINVNFYLHAKVFSAFADGTSESVKSETYILFCVARDNEAATAADKFINC